MFLKIFLAAITVCSLLGCLGANRRDNKRIAAVVAIVAPYSVHSGNTGGKQHKGKRSPGGSSKEGSDDYRKGRRMGNDYH